MTSDGRVRLFRAIQQIAGGLDRHHAMQGIGVVVLFGTVVQAPPDLKIAIEGLTQATDSETFLLSWDNLLIPDNIRLSQGDRITLLPVQANSATKMLVHSKMRTTDIQPTENMRIGYNGDLTNPGGFVGVEVSVIDANENSDSSILVQGDTVNIASIGGAQVVIDGINWSTHVHSSTPRNTGPPQNP